MDEQTVFQNLQNVQVPPQSEAPVQNPPPPENNVPSPEAANETPPPPSFSPFSFLTQNVLKIVIGIFIVIFIFFAFFRFILPAFKPQKAEDVTLVYWGLWEDENIVKPAISDFQKQNPHIKIDYSRQNIKGYKDRLLVRSENGNGPDIFRFHNTWLPQVSKILVPLPSDVIKKEEFQKSYYPVASTDLVSNGAIYGIPLEIDTLALYLNSDILKAAGIKPPTSWDEFQNDAASLTTVDGNGKINTAGAAMGTYDNITHASDIISLLLAQNGANMKNFSETPQNVTEALDFYRSFSKPDNNGRAIWDKDQEESLIAFSKGNLAMYIGYSWDIFSIESFKRVYKSDFSEQIVPMPQLPSPARPVTIASYWAEGVSGRSKHQKEALIFMKFLTQKETQQKLFTEESKIRLYGEPYSRTDLADLLKGNQTLYPFVSQGKIAVSSYFSSNTDDNGINDNLNVYLKKAVDSINNNSSTQTAADTLIKGMSQELKKYGL